MTTELKQIIFTDPKLVDQLIDLIEIKTLILFSIKLIKQNNKHAEELFIKYIDMIYLLIWDFNDLFKYSIIKNLSELNIEKYEKYINIILDKIPPIFKVYKYDEDDLVSSDEIRSSSLCIEIINTIEFFTPIFDRIIHTSRKNKNYIKYLIDFIHINFDEIDENIIKMIFTKCGNNKKTNLYLYLALKNEDEMGTTFSDFLLNAKTQTVKEFLFERIFTERYKMTNYGDIFDYYEEFFTDIHIMKKYLKKTILHPFSTKIRLRRMYSYYQKNIFDGKDMFIFIQQIMKTSIKLKIHDLLGSRELNNIKNVKYYVQFGYKINYTKFIL